MKKILIITGVTFLVVLIGVVVLVQMLITPERVKAWAVPHLEEHLQREVALGDIDIGLFSGIALNDLQIRAKDGENDLFKIGELVLSYQFLPLLSGRLAIDEIRLIGPEIRLVQKADGSMNIDDLLGGSHAEKKHDEQQKGEPRSGEGVELLVKRVLLENGQLILVRETADDIQVQKLRVLATNIALDKSFPVELSVRFNETDFLFDGEFDPSRQTGRLNLAVKQLDLNRFVPQDEGAKAKQKPTDKKSAPGPEVGPIEVPVTLSGTVRIDELLYQGLTVTQLQADYKLADNRFQLQPLSGVIADGQFKLQADIDLARKGLAYTGNFSLDGLDLKSLIPLLVPEAENSTHGMMQVKIDFSGHGTHPDRALKQLASQGNFTLSEGKLMGSPLLAEFARFLGNPELKVLSFRSMSGKYDLQQGQARIQALLDSSKTRIESSGTVALAGPLDLDFATRLAPELVEGLGSKSKFGRALTDPDGWAVLPLQIGGTYQDPKFSLSSEGMKSQAKEKAVQEVEKKLQKQLGDDASANELLGEPLKKLFGD